MSEKRYIIVSPSHHNKPRAFFLSEPLEGETKPTWRYYLENTLLFTLEQAKKAADETPIGCYIVEHNENLRMWLSEKEGIKFATLVEIAIGEGCEVIGDLPQSMQPETQAKETSEPREEREYLLYYSRSYEAGYRYYSSDGGETFDKSLAQVMTYTEANEKINELSVKGQYQWLHKKVKIEPAAESETLAPEAKKRVGYVLQTGDDAGQVYYYAGSRDDLGYYFGSKKAKLYRTPDDAQFAADILNPNTDTTFGWQVEKIEF